MERMPLLYVTPLFLVENICVGNLISVSALLLLWGVSVHLPLPCLVANPMPSLAKAQKVIPMSAVAPLADTKHKNRQTASFLVCSSYHHT